MNRTPPKLSRHVTGQYFIHWGGKRRYLGRKKDIALQLYVNDPINGLPAWEQWRGERDQRMKAPPLQGGAHTVIDVAELFIDTKEAGGRYRVGDGYRNHLKRFLTLYGDMRADLARSAHLGALAQSMASQGYAPSTIRHDLTAAKSMLNWAMDMEYIPFRRLKAKAPPIGHRKRRDYPRWKVRAATHFARDESMGAWLAINYLACARPSEVMRLVHREGEWIETGVFEMASKVEHRTEQPRWLILCAEALEYLKIAEPTWTRLDSYSQAVRDWFGGQISPGPLRHSAATHLIHEHATERLDVETLLGHSSATNRESVRYARIAFQRLRAVAAQLTLRS